MSKRPDPSTKPPNPAPPPKKAEYKLVSCLVRGHSICINCGRRNDCIIHIDGKIESLCECQHPHD